MKFSLSRRLAAEFLGTGFLVAAVVGSGIMGERLAGGNVAIALLANTLATGAALVTLILVFLPISGAHFNPVVSLALASRGGIGWGEAALYSAAQISGGIAGTACANVMFALPAFFLSHRVRTGPPQWFSEFVATFGLLLVIRVCARLAPARIAVAVAAYITAAYWFTASTSFANPAVAIARSLTDTFAGIRPADVPAFIAAELSGGFFAVLVSEWLVRGPARARLEP
ncbi:MAG TPA: MIP/aquaporin family protein [Verrucomicrobiae bacterium]|jgi:glycerol uptake facilitator-like aquaporin|nr:MIP/aquaporin family protein [Verrucomicrobiae bacterium]